MHPSASFRPGAPYLPAEGAGSIDRGPATTATAHKATRTAPPPASVHPGDQGDALIAAAVAQGAFSKVAAELVEGCYGGPDLIDEICLNDLEAKAVRHAIDDEYLRLQEWARSVAAHIRKLAGGRCICGATLHLAPEANVPARYCSIQCASNEAHSPVIR